MNAKQMWIGGIILVLFSVWLGVQIGVDRDWIAGIFLYVVPAITLTSLTIVTLRSKADKKASSRKDIQFVIEQLESLKGEVYKINELISTMNSIERKIDLVEKKISSPLITSSSVNYIESKEL